ncbi:MAG: hypothetical protein KA004_12985 [Verrucomicrobiales bacterium]|nr:hypothetical protein [Verrucomicrobiales bacterium]
MVLLVNSTFVHLLRTASALAVGLLAGCGKKEAQPAAPSSPAPPDAGTVRDFAGELNPVAQQRRLRIVWVQHAQSGAADVAAKSAELILLGLDSQDQRGIRRISPDTGNFFQPLLTSDGARVVVTDRSAEPVIHLIDWENGRRIMLGSGAALCVWKDPATLDDWVYALEEIEPGTRGSLVGHRVVRFLLKQPDDREIVWVESPVEAASFRVSRDGRRAAAQVPAPAVARLNFGSGREMHPLSQGLWPSLAPDNSYVAWSFDAAQSALVMAAPNQRQTWQIPLPAAPGMPGGGQFWHPRWSNHVGVFAFSGPYLRSPEDPAYADKADGAGAEIWLGRLGPGGSEILSTVRVTTNDRSDGFPDVWVEGPAVETLAGFPQAPEDKPDEEPKPWPVNSEGALFVWDTAARDNKLPSADGERICRVEARGFASFGRHFDMALSGGAFEADAISSQAIGPACQQANAWTLEAMITESREGLEPLSLRLISYADAAGFEIFGLYRVDNSLVLRLRMGTADEAPQVHPVKLANHRIDNEKPYHLTLSLSGGKLRVFFEGVLSREIALEKPALSGWTAGRLQMGDLQPYGGNQWQGVMEAVAVYARSLTEDEVQKNHAAARQKAALRRPISRVRLRGKLLEATPVPPLGAGQPYPRLLLASTYAVEKVLYGICEQKTVVVLHWAVMDRKPVPGMPREIGRTYEMLLEPESGHPELQAERIQSAVAGVHAPRFIDVLPPASHESNP